MADVQQIMLRRSSPPHTKCAGRYASVTQMYRSQPAGKAAPQNNSSTRKGFVFMSYNSRFAAFLAETY